MTTQILILKDENLVIKLKLAQKDLAAEYERNKRLEKLRVLKLKATTCVGLTLQKSKQQMV